MGVQGYALTSGTAYALENVEFIASTNNGENSGNNGDPDDGNQNGLYQWW